MAASGMHCVILLHPPYSGPALNAMSLNTDDFINSRSLRVSGRKILGQKYLRALILIGFEFSALSLAVETVNQLSPRSIAPSLVGLAIIFLPFCVVQYLTGQYFSRRSEWKDAGATVNTILLMLLFSSSAFYVNPEGALISIGFWLIAALFIPFSRFLARQLLRLTGLWTRNVVILGVGPKARLVAQNLIQSPLLGYKVSLFIDPQHIGDGDTEAIRFDDDIDFLATQETFSDSIRINDSDIPILSELGALNQILSTLGAPRVIIALEDDEQHQIAPALIRRLEFSPCDLSVIPPKSQLPSVGVEIETLGKDEIIVLKMRNNAQRFTNRFMKRGFDLVAAALGLIVLSPVFLIITVLVGLSGWPIVFSHTRIGKNGRSFKCYKFRSMVPNAQAVLNRILETDLEARKEWQTTFKLKDDPRITKLGSVLRSTSLDELPQLFNVVKGDMSLVGPRPITLEELSLYGEYRGFYLANKPGCTGLWQVSGRNDTSYAERVDLDIWYAKNWSLWNDIGIILQTVAVIFKRDGAY